MVEKELFTYLKNMYLADLTFAEDSMSRWDCVSDHSKVRIELKCRRTHYDTLLLEKKKYDAMIESVKGSGYRPLYINSTPKGIYSFDLSEIKPKWIVNNLNPATTDFSDNGKVYKEVAYLELDKSTKIK